MAKEKKVEVVEEKVVAEAVPEVVSKVQLLTQEFGNGDDRILRDKINEIIKSL